MPDSTQATTSNHRRKPIRIVLADDHKLMREGLRALMRRLENVEVVADAGDGREALTAVNLLRPDGLVTGICMKGLNGPEVTARATKDYPGVSAKTVEGHRRQLMERLDVHDVAGPVRYAIRHHLVDAVASRQPATPTPGQSHRLTCPARGLGALLASDCMGRITGTQQCCHSPIWYLRNTLRKLRLLIPYSKGFPCQGTSRLDPKIISR